MPPSNLRRRLVQESTLQLASYYVDVLIDQHMFYGITTRICWRHKRETQITTTGDTTEGIGDTVDRLQRLGLNRSATSLRKLN